MDNVTKQAGSDRDSGCFSVSQLSYCGVLLASIHLQFTSEIWMCLQCDAPCHGHLTKFFFSQIISEPGCANLIESCVFLQRLHGCNYKLNTVAWLVELPYGHVVFICEEFVRWPWDGAFHCNGTHTKSDRVV